MSTAEPTPLIPETSNRSGQRPNLRSAEPTPNVPETSNLTKLQTRPLAGLLVALLAGLAAWGVLQVTLPVFRIPDELALLPTPAPIEKLLELDAAMGVASRQNAAYALGIAGALMGVFLAAAESVSRGRVLTSIPKGLFAGLLAGLAGVAAGWLGSPTRDALMPVTDWSPMAKTIVLQMVVLGLVALGVGLGISLPYARFRLLVHCLLGAVLAAALAAIIYPPVMGYLRPIADTELVVPGSRGGLLPWLLLFTGLTGLVLTGLGRRRPAVP
jgi:hypothetical protein